MWQDLLTTDAILNNYFGFKYVYFKNGFPLSASLVEENPSGDFLFGKFFAERPKYISVENGMNIGSYNGYTNSIISANFGETFTDPLEQKYDYNIETKTLTVYGIIENDTYKSQIKSIHSSETGITHIVSLENKNTDYPIKLHWERRIESKLGIRFD